MKEYKIKMMDHAPMCPKCWSRIEKTMIDECVWMDDYKPVCYAQVCYVKGDGFYARLTCEETNPKAVHEGFFSDVYKDSCLEMFAKWDDASDKYINIEMNSKGASLIALGADRHERKTNGTSSFMSPKKTFARSTACLRTSSFPVMSSWVTSISAATKPISNITSCGIPSEPKIPTITDRNSSAAW